MKNEGRKTEAVALFNTCARWYNKLLGKVPRVPENDLLIEMIRALNEKLLLEDDVSVFFENSP